MDNNILDIAVQHKYNFASRDECLQALLDEAPENRIKAIESLIELGELHDISQFVELAKKDHNLIVQKTAIKALAGKIEAFEPLIEILQLGNIPQIIESVVIALQQLGDPRAIPYIKKAQNEVEDEALRKSIQAIIEQMEELSASLKATEDTLKEDITEKIDAGYLETLLGPLEIGDDERPFDYFREVLVNRERESLLKLRSLLSDRNARTRLRAIIALSNLPYDQEIKDSMLFALQDEDDSVRLQAVHTLLKSKDCSIAKRIFPLIADPNPIISMEVSRFLLDYSTPEILQMATDSLESDNISLKIRAAAFLARTDSEIVMPIIVGLLQDTQQPPELIIAIIGSLKARRAQYVGRALPTLLKKGDKQILKHLSLFFRKVNDPNLYGVLRKNLVSGDPRIRHGSVFLVGQAGDKRSLENLVELLNDPYDSIKIQAAWSLANLKAKEAYESVLKVYEENTDIKLRKAFLEILTRIDLQKSLSIILDACSAPSPEIRYHAAQLLGLFNESGKDDAVQALQSNLHDKDMRVVFLSINSLINLGIEDFSKPVESIISILKTYLFDKRQASSLREQAIYGIKFLLKEKSIPIFVEILKNEKDEKVLIAASEALSSFKDLAAFNNLTDLLFGANSFVRKKVVQALCTKEDPAAVPHLLKYIEKFHKPQETSFDVTTYLITEYVNRTLTIPWRSGIEEIFLSLFSQKSLSIRQMITFHLAYGGSENILEPFLKLLKSPFPTLYYLAALGLARIGYSQVVQPLIDILQDNELACVKDPKEKAKVKKDLNKYYSLLSRFKEFQDNEYGPTDSKKILAATFLGKLKQKEAIQPLMKLSQNKEPEIVTAAIKALENFDDPSIIPHLLELKETRTDFIIQNSINSIILQQKDKTRTHLFSLLQSNSPEKRAFAARTLAEIKGLASGKELMKYLEDEFWLVRYWTVTAIAMSGEKSKEFISQLFGKVKDPSPLVRSGALYAMINMRDERFKTILLNALRDPHFFVRAEASKIVGVLKVKDGEKILIDNLSDFSVSVRAAAARALGGIGSHTALTKLRKIAETCTNQEKVWAIYAIKLINGEKNIDDLACFLEYNDDDRPEEILVLKTGKPTIIKYYPGVYKKLAELGIKPAPLLYREEFDEFKKGYTDFILRFVKSLDRIYVEKISEKKENYYQAIEALGAMGTPEVAGLLGEILKGKKEKTIKLAAMRALSSMRFPEAQKALIPGLIDPSPEINIKAAQLLRQHIKNLKNHITAYLDEREVDQKKKNRIYKILGITE